MNIDINSDYINLEEYILKIFDGIHSKRSQFQKTNLNYGIKINILKFKFEMIK